MDPVYSRRPIDAAATRKPGKPGAFKRLPWSGFGALIAAILGVGTSIAILITSNNQPITGWTFQPTVYLAIASTLTNILIHYAFAQGVTIAWWRRAMKENT